MKELKAFIAGMLVTLLLLNPFMALGEAVAENIEVYFNKVNININGNPQEIDNFTYKNTVYVPLRAMATAFDKEIRWDNKTNTVNVNDVEVISEKRGNSIGNVANGSKIAFDREWIYYVNMEENSKVYKMKKNGSNKTKLYDKFSRDLNIFGGCLYFASYDDKHMYRGIFKMETDGSNHVKVVNDSNDYSIIVDDWIYYTNDDERIYKVKIDGSCVTRLNDDPSRSLLVHNGWIYYIAQWSIGGEDKDTLYKIRVDGSDRTKLSEDLVRYVNIEGDWLYYINYHDYAKTHSQSGLLMYFPDEIYKLRLDGSEKTLVVKDDTKGMIVSDGWIYYTTGSQLCKVKTDGSGKVVLMDKVYRIQNLYIIDEWIYCIINGQQSYELFRMKLDGTDKEQIY